MNEGTNKLHCCDFHHFFRGVPFSLVSMIILFETWCLPHALTHDKVASPWLLRFEGDFLICPEPRETKHCPQSLWRFLRRLKFSYNPEFHFHGLGSFYRSLLYSAGFFSPLYTIALHLPISTPIHPPQITSAQLCRQIWPKLSGKGLHESISSGLEFNIRHFRFQKPQNPWVATCLHSLQPPGIWLPPSMQWPFLFFHLLSSTPHPRCRVISCHLLPLCRPVPWGPTTPRLKTTVKVSSHLGSKLSSRLCGLRSQLW